MCALRASSEAALEAHDIRVHIRGVKAVDGVDLAARRSDPRPDRAERGRQDHARQRCSPASSARPPGRVLLDGRDITTWEPSEIARAGRRRARFRTRACSPA